MSKYSYNIWIISSTSRIAVRTVYCVLLISGITLENAYSGGLKALLTVPRYVYIYIYYSGYIFKV